MKFCTAINCMDGRVQEPVIAYMKNRTGADVVDMITEPGPNGILASGEPTQAVESILRRVRISVEKHGSIAVAVIGHDDCAGNPSPPDVQAEQTRAAVDLLRSRFPGVKVSGLWIDDEWRVSAAE